MVRIIVGTLVDIGRGKIDNSISANNRIKVEIDGRAYGTSTWIIS